MSTNPLQIRLAAIWDTAMGDGNGMAAAAALSQAITAAWDVEAGTGPGWVQDTALDLLIAPAADPGPVWLAVASNTLGSMLREARAGDSHDR